VKDCSVPFGRHQRIIGHRFGSHRSMTSIGSPSRNAGEMLVSMAGRVAQSIRRRNPGRVSHVVVHRRCGGQHRRDPQHRIARRRNACHVLSPHQHGHGGARHGDRRPLSRSPGKARRRMANAQRTMLYDWFQDFGVSVDRSKGVMGMPFSADHYTGRGRLQREVFRQQCIAPLARTWKWRSDRAGLPAIAARILRARIHREIPRLR
jgi:hypothetical protein